MMRAVVIVQARMTSTRLPGKVLARIAGEPMVGHVLDRAARIPGVAEVLLATSDRPSDDPLASWVRGRGFQVVRGSEWDVLSRFHQAAETVTADAIVRVTADCPLLDPGVSGQVVAAWERGGVAYASNTAPPTYPDGLDTEVIARDALDVAFAEAGLMSEREHVTPFIRNRPDRFPAVNVVGSPDRSQLRWTVDEPEDLAFVRRVFSLAGSVEIGYADVIDIIEGHPDLTDLNRGFSRNEGLARSIEEDRSVGPM